MPCHDVVVQGPPRCGRKKIRGHRNLDAMKRKETYGTSGTLIRLRFFGGWVIRPA